MSSSRFTGKKAIITGAASGIGLALTNLIVGEGGQVFAADINPDFVNSDVENIKKYQCDVSDSEQVSNMINAAIDHYGKIDLLFNNAGIGSLGETPELEDEAWQRVFAINVDAVMWACRAIIPHMREQGGGVIVNTASISGLFADYGFTAYNASKAAVINFTRCLAIDHGKDNIRVNAICPGFIESTGLTGGLDGTPVKDLWTQTVPLGRGGTAEEMAKVAAFLASDDASYVTGSIMIADGGLTAHTGQPNLMALGR